ncbi:MAG: carboxypeptidase-like regulatory domain-containing protein [Acidobacteriota bacterium]
MGKSERFSFLIPFSILAVAVTAGEERFVITGRILDSKGQPVIGAQVTLHPPGPAGDLIVFTETDESGRFRYEAPTSSTIPHEEILYAVSPLPEDAYAPITPPYDDELKAVNSALNGKRVRVLKNKEEEDLGDLPLQVHYRKIEVHLRDPAGARLIVDQSGWQDLWIRIKDENGRTVSEAGLSRREIESAVLVDQSAICVALPEGVWSIEVSLTEQRGPWYASRRNLDLRRHSRSVRVTITVQPVGK